MIYAASLASYLKKAKIEGLFQSSIRDIRAKLPDDPRTSKMDVIVLAEKDVTSLQGKRILTEIPKRHEDITVVYIYQAEENGGLLSEGPKIHKFRLSKISAETVGRVMGKVLEGLDISSADKRVFTNEDAEAEVKGEESKSKGFFGFLSSKNKKDSKETKNKIRRPGGGKVEFEDTGFIKNEYPEESEIEIDSDMQELQKHALSPQEIAQREQGIADEDEEAVVIYSGESDTQEDTYPEVEQQPELEFSNTEMPKRNPPVQESRKPEHISLQERIERVNFGDAYDLIKTSLSRSELNRDLLQQDAEYAGCKYVLEQWDREILQLSRDSSISAEERFSKIRELAFKRTERKGTANNKLMQYMSVIMNTVTEVCQKTINEKSDELRKSLATVIDVQVVNATEQEMAKLIGERNKVIVELREYLADIVNIYQVMDISVSDMINSQTEDLPSANTFVNNQFALEKDLFVPQNASMLTARILNDLRDNLLKFSQMENLLQSLIGSVFNLIDKDSAIIQEQEKRYQMLRDVRVEETVIITNVLKNALRIFVGPNEAGVTSTALTWAGLRARRQNTILIDLREDNSKLTNYGESPMDMNEFLDGNEQRHFVVLKGKLNSKLDLEELINRLSKKTDYYSSINLIFDDSQVAYVNRCVDSALSVNIITNSTISNVEKTKMFMTDFMPSNVGIKIVAIDPAVERLEFLQKLDVDQYVSQVIGIAYMKDMRQCAIRNEHPYERQVIADTFEEAFR